MASVFPGSRRFSSALALPSGRRLARGMSRHSSAAMLLFAVWQIWLAMSLSPLPGGTVLPWAALALLIVGAIPLTRRLERRWHRLASDALPCPGLISAYRRDRALLWSLAVVTPPLWLGLALLVVGMPSLVSFSF